MGDFNANMQYYVFFFQWERTVYALSLSITVCDLSSSRRESAEIIGFLVTSEVISHFLQLNKAAFMLFKETVVLYLYA